MISMSLMNDSSFLLNIISSLGNWVREAIEKDCQQKWREKCSSINYFGKQKNRLPRRPLLSSCSESVTAEESSRSIQQCRYYYSIRYLGRYRYLKLTYHHIYLPTAEQSTYLYHVHSPRRQVKTFTTWWWNKIIASRYLNYRRVEECCIGAGAAVGLLHLLSLEGDGYKQRLRWRNLD